MSRGLIIFFIVALVAAIIYNLAMISYVEPLSDWNIPYFIGLAASICGIIFALIMFQVNRLKKNVEKAEKN